MLQPVLSTVIANVEVARLAVLQDIYRDAWALRVTVPLL